MNPGKKIFNFDNTDKILIRFVALMVSTIVLGILIYDLLIPYGVHDEIIKLSLVIGGFIGVMLQLAIHKLRTKYMKK